MKYIKLSLWGMLLGLTAFWALANVGLTDTLTFIAIRNYLMQYSGVISIGAMSAAGVVSSVLVLFNLIGKTR